jgi:SGNH domain (fused to AT3 domains)
LWHWPMLSFMRIVESETPAPYLRNMAVVSSFLLAWLTYRFVERPIRANDKSGLKIAVMASLIAALGVAGWVIYQSNGIPSRPAAKADGVNVWDNYAFAGTCKLVTQAPEQDDWCNMGNAPSKPPTTLLIGDSVGNNFAPMLNAFAAANADSTFVFRQMGRGLCHGLPEIGYENCIALVAATDTYIASTPSIHTIIMAANWPLYYDGFDMGTTGKVTSAQFKAAFEARVARYQGLGKRVIVFLAPPNGVSPRACVVRPIRLTDHLSDKSNCVMAKIDAVTKDGDYRSYFAGVLAQKGITTFDPFKYMCDDKTCKVTDGTQIYYLDHEHFSIYGGQFLAKVAGDELKQLLSAPQKDSK